MKPMHRTRLFIVAAMALAALFMGGTVRRAHAQQQPAIVPMYFTGIVGGDKPWGRRLLLRWATLDKLVEIDSAVLFRTNAANQREQIAIVRKTRDAAVILSIFNRPGEEKIHQAAEDVLKEVYGDAGNTPAEFAAKIIDLIDGKGASEYNETRRTFLQQINYGFAIMEGNGWLDFVKPAEGPFTYELWQGDAAGTPITALGRIYIDAANPQPLPVPVGLHEVQLRGRDGVTPARGNNRRIYLDWNQPPDLGAKVITSFGYDIFRLNRPLKPGETFDDVKGELIRLNKGPILPPSPLEGTPADQAYAFADTGDWLASGNESALLPVGATFTYWAAARDLLGQNGLPSAPVQATVRDTFEPNTPRGLSVVPARIANNEQLLRASWNVQTEDTASFKLYRYQQYINQGKKGPFPDIDGLTEGLIATIPANAPDPDQKKFTYDDTTAASAPKATGFWYCISAVDQYGNESALSPPAYGVIDEVVGPNASRVTRYCTSVASLFVSGSLSVPKAGRQPVWTPLFLFDKRSPVYSLVQIYRKGTGSVNPDVLIDEVTLAAQGPTFWSPPEDTTVLTAANIPTYRIIAFTHDGSTETVDIAPPSAWVPLNPRVQYTVVLDVRGFESVCVDQPTLVPGNVVVVPGGNAPTLELDLACGDSTVSTRLYRSVDGGQSYEQVGEFSCGGGSVNVKENFQPEGLAEIKYYTVNVDKHGNLGSPNFLPQTFINLGDIPSPVLLDVKATGTNANRTATIRWTGPRVGVDHYRISFLSKQIATGKPLEYAVGDLAYDAPLNQFSVTTSKRNREGDPFDSTTDWKVKIEAVPVVGTARAGTKQLPFNWGVFDLQGNQLAELRWTPRPLPPVIPRGTTFNDTFFSEDFGGSVFVLWNLPSPEAGVGGGFFPDPPIQVWRRRVDKAGQPWIAVSPLLREINYAGKFMNDPFFQEREYLQAPGIYFVDNSGHVQGATYEYYFVNFDLIRGEIKSLVGPMSVDIVTPG